MCVLCLHKSTECQAVWPAKICRCQLSCASENKLYCVNQFFTLSCACCIFKQIPCLPSIKRCEQTCGSCWPELSTAQKTEQTGVKGQKEMAAFSFLKKQGIVLFSEKTHSLWPVLEILSSIMWEVTASFAMKNVCFCVDFKKSPELPGKLRRKMKTQQFGLWHSDAHFLLGCDNWSCLEQTFVDKTHLTQMNWTLCHAAQIDFLFKHISWPLSQVATSTSELNDLKTTGPVMLGVDWWKAKQIISMANAINHLHTNHMIWIHWDQCSAIGSDKRSFEIAVIAFWTKANHFVPNANVSGCSNCVASELQNMECKSLNLAIVIRVMELNFSRRKHMKTA